MTLASTAGSLSPTRAGTARRFGLRLAGLAALVALADGSFFDHPPGGAAVALFVPALVLSARLFDPDRATPGRRRMAGILVAAAVIAALADGGALSSVLAFATAGVAALLLAVPAMRWERLTIRLIGLPFVGWVRLPRDLMRARRIGLRRDGGHVDWNVWVVPIALSLVFLAIFIVANPVVELWVSRLDPTRLLADADLGRLVFWAMVAPTLSPFVGLGRSARPGPTEHPRAPSALSSGGYLGRAATIRALVAFNLIFAVQTVTDLGCLWSGAGLPAGMTHAEYAHRGAYPLMVAAMVAAGFVLLALRSSEAERDRLLRPLLLAFVAQGLLLVVSAMLRLDLYVAVYSLTRWRLAAFVWMGLVAFGFATILLRVLAHRSNRWLKSVDAAAVVVTLWGWCFVDDVDLVARWNIAHCREVTGQGTGLDVDYLIGLGARAVPALDAARERLEGRERPVLDRDTDPRGSLTLAARRDRVVRDRLARPRDWRRWSFADWRLDRYLSTMPMWSDASCPRVPPCPPL